MKTKRIICLYGGPCSEKSTTCAGLFYFLKRMKFDAEMNREYIKEWIWEGREIHNGDQPYFFAKMARRERIYMQNGMDYIITDSPLILTHFYGVKYDPMERAHNTSLMMLKNHHQICKDFGYKVEHYFLERQRDYNPKGRNETEEQARQIDEEVKVMLGDLGIKFQSVPSGEGVSFVLSDLGVIS